MASSTASLLGAGDPEHLVPINAADGPGGWQLVESALSLPVAPDQI